MGLGDRYSVNGRVSAGAECGAVAGLAREEAISIGKYRLMASPFNLGKIWVCKDDGEGGEFDTDMLETLLDEVWDGHF